MPAASRFAAIVTLLSAPLWAGAATVSAFAEDFEGNLSAWTGINNGAITQAAIVADPLRSGNHVLGFPSLGSAGSIYSRDFISTTGQFTVNFEYLGLAKSGSRAGDLGGFFGISQAFAGNHQWIAGTLDNWTSPFVNLIDDGTWHSYSLTFTSKIGQAVHLMFEDFVGSGGVTGDVFFDNIQFNDASVTPAPLPNAVPEPASVMLAGLALAAAGVARRRRA